jgi:RNA polymerase sigma factor (sigma-70 family)
MPTFDFGGTAAGAPIALLTPQQQSSLAEGLRSRVPAAEQELVRLFADRVMFMALARTRDREAARDVAQDVMLAVFRAVRDGQLHESERLAAFVYGIARNLINNYLRTRTRLKEDPLDAALPLSPQADTAETEERLGLVRRALRTLDLTDRTILLLTLVEGLKPGEIALRLGLTPEVVRTRKSRALKRTTERVKNLSRT